VLVLDRSLTLGAALLRSVSSAGLALAMLACGGGGPSPALRPPLLEPRDLATHASEFYCAHGRWPDDVSELEAFPPPAVPRTQLAGTAGDVPWRSLEQAVLRRQADGSLLVIATLSPGSLADRPPDLPLELHLRVERPGCWPPLFVGTWSNPATR
jgi:hypothetical protein